MTAAQVYSQFKRFDRTPSAMMAFCDWCEDNGVVVPHLEVLPERFKYSTNLIELLVFIWSLTGAETDHDGNVLPDGWLTTEVSMWRKTHLGIRLSHNAKWGTDHWLLCSLYKYGRYRRETLSMKLDSIRFYARDLPAKTMHMARFWVGLSSMFQEQSTGKSSI